MGIFIKEHNKDKSYISKVVANDPIEFLGEKDWYLKASCFANCGDNNYSAFIFTFPLFAPCDMHLILNENYKLVQIGSRYTEIVTTYDDNKYFSYKWLPILQLVKSEDDISKIDCYELCKKYFKNDKISKVQL